MRHLYLSGLTRRLVRLSHKAARATSAVVPIERTSTRANRVCPDPEPSTDAAVKLEHDGSSLSHGSDLENLERGGIPQRGIPRRLSPLAGSSPANVSTDEPLPHGWQRFKSRSRPDEFAYRNMITGQRVRKRPTAPAAGGAYAAADASDVDEHVSAIVARLMAFEKPGAADP